MRPRSGTVSAFPQMRSVLMHALEQRTQERLQKDRQSAITTSRLPDLTRETGRLRGNIGDKVHPSPAMDSVTDGWNDCPFSNLRAFNAEAIPHCAASFAGTADLDCQPTIS